ncbi:hypothetical protein G5I_03462 [Acromyrmex echinatior]|uniref:Uncharacterized protein n=1 Tax=Acromyrmex echinatior TaxID=103372 RepID=F4WD20_ACREC|nr:hypothetical protein G5I_03462 [Acromyrmex echinatior]
MSSGGATLGSAIRRRFIAPRVRDEEEGPPAPPPPHTPPSSSCSFTSGMGGEVSLATVFTPWGGPGGDSSSSDKSSGQFSTSPIEKYQIKRLD